MAREKLGVVGTISVVFALLNGIGLMLSVGLSLIIRHRCLAIYEDFDVHLPAITMVFVALPIPIWILVTMVLLGILAVKEFLPNKPVRLLLNGIFVLCGFVYWVIFFMAMQLPLIQIIHEMS